MTPSRKKAESLIYDTMDALDKTGQNSAYYKEKFAKMTDKQFSAFVSQDLPFKFQHKPFEIEPTMADIKKASDVVGFPLMEKVHLPFLYENKDGVPVTSKEALVIYPPLKKMKQFITKKNSMSTDISQRDMKTGLLINFDKNAQTSDREFESLAVMGLDNTMLELSRHRADAMKAKSEMYNTTNTTGKVTLAEIPVDVDDSLAKNLLNVYMLGSLLRSNLISEDDMLASTMKDKQRKVERET